MTTTQMTHEERMKAAFEIAANPLDWRAPIRISGNRAVWASIERITGITQADIVESIQFYTSTEATVTVNGDDIEIKAAGYRAGPAGP